MWTWSIIAFDGSSAEPTLISQLYKGYTIKPAESVIGFAWAIIDGAIGGAKFAWTYNFFVSSNKSSA